MSWKYLDKSKISSERMYEVLRTPVISEKSTMGGSFNQVTFKVAEDATKGEVKQAVEGLFKVNVEAVNTVNQAGKSKRFRGRLGVRNGYKKAIVTLQEGHSIDVGAGL